MPFEVVLDVDSKNVEGVVKLLVIIDHSHEIMIISFAFPTVNITG